MISWYLVLFTIPFIIHVHWMLLSKSCLPKWCNLAPRWKRCQKFWLMSIFWESSVGIYFLLKIVDSLGCDELCFNKAAEMMLDLGSKVYRSDTLCIGHRKQPRSLSINLPIVLRISHWNRDLITECQSTNHKVGSILVNVNRQITTYNVSR